MKGGPGLGHAQVGKEIFQHEAKEVMHMMNSLQSSEMEPDDPQARPSVDRQSRASRGMDVALDWLAELRVSEQWGERAMLRARQQ